MDSEPTVFVVDDDPIARNSIAALIRSKGIQAETYESAESFLGRFDQSSAGCLVVDVRMSGMSGLELQEQLADHRIHLPVIIITGYANVPMAVRAMRGGAVTFLEKPCHEQDLWNAIETALEKDAGQRDMLRQQEEIRNRLATLTEGELAVMEKVIEGKPNKVVASELDIGLRTVELRRATILKKMEAGSLAELVQMAAAIEFTSAAPKE